jgi:putative endonuclease
MTKRQIGEEGERIATQYLEKQGYTILDTNWHCRYGELDIVSRKAEIIVFCEVKTRRAATNDETLATITPPKRHRLIKSVYAYLKEHELDDAQWRIDAIAIAFPYRGQPIIEHVEDALGW